jgi:serine/threonine protein kinase
VVEVQVVRKQLKVKGMTKEFEREERCLRLLNQLQHPNIIPLWGSYTYRGEQNFLFPYVDIDLGKFLMAKTRYRDFQWDFTFYSALTGLASALSKTHRLHLNQANHDVDFEAIGYHHDLRPPNVLVSPDTFILADFGLGRLKSAEALSHTPYKSISGDYIAPECTDMEENPQTVNRAIDVWAFGCLIVEVVTYMLKGADGVEDFRTKRLTTGRLPQWKDAGFYQPHGDVKQEVLDWMEALRRDNPHPDLVPQLVELSLQALQVDPQSRPDVNNMHHRLAVLSLQKHFHSVQDMFREVCGTREISAPLAEHHIESLRFAQERFEVWGHALTLGEKSVSSYAYEQSESSVKIMKKLIHALREGPGRRHSGDRSAMFSLEHVIVQSVEDLWKLLPDNLLQSAENQWQEALSNSELVEQMHCSRYVTLGDLPSASMAAPINALQCEFEEAARVFKDNLPDSIPLDEILKVTSSNDVYDITDKIQEEQQTRNGLRNLPKMRLYLERLEGYAGVINDIINGSRDVLALLWGPIALLLQWSRTLGTAYDSIINVAAEVGQALPDFQASAAIFDQNIEAKEILMLFLKDLLNFYREALEPFSHPSKYHRKMCLSP